MTAVTLVDRKEVLKLLPRIQEQAGPGRALGRAFGRSLPSLARACLLLLLLLLAFFDRDLAMYTETVSSAASEPLSALVCTAACAYCTSRPSGQSETRTRGGREFFRDLEGRRDVRIVLCDGSGAIGNVAEWAFPKANIRPVLLSGASRRSGSADVRR